MNLVELQSIADKVEVAGPDREQIEQLFDEVQVGLFVLATTNPQAATDTIGALIRLTYSLGYQRGKASSLTFVVADETP